MEDLEAPGGEAPCSHAGGDGGAGVGGGSDTQEHGGHVWREVQLGPGRLLRIREFDLQDEAGAVVWDAGLMLAHYLAYRHSQGRCEVAGRVCVDLGAGTGVVGMAAASLEAAHVLLTDLPHLVPYIRANVQANSLGATCSVQALRWGDAAQVEAARRVLGLAADDGTEAGSARAVPLLLLAADTVYTPDARSSLFATLATLLPRPPPPGPRTSAVAAPRTQSKGGMCAPSARSHSGEGLPAGDGYALLSYEDRPGVEELPALCEEHGLAAAEVPPHELHPDWHSPDLHVLRLWRRAA